MSNTSPTKGHTRKKKRGCFCVYSVYDGKTTLPVIIDGTAAECAAVMGIAVASFYSELTRVRKHESKRWEIYRRYLDGGEDLRIG